jgi:hypothetical protein
MTDSIHSQVLIVQNDTAFGHQIAQHLHKDRHDILGSVSKVTSAYKTLMNNLPDLALIDVSIGEDKINRLSDTLILMGVPHLINDGDHSALTKRTLVDGQENVSQVYCAAPLQESIAHTLWDMHIQRVMFHWLDDAVLTETLVA